MAGMSAYIKRVSGPAWRRYPVWLVALGVAVAACTADPPPAKAPTSGDAADATDGAGDAGAIDTVSKVDTVVVVDAASDTVTADAGSADGGGDPFVAQLGGACAMEKRVGRFEILEDALYGSSVAGNVADRIDALQILVAQQTEGACTLWQRKAAACTPSCTGTQQCVRDQGCKAFPAPLSTGAVAVTGLVKPVSMQPKGANLDYFYTDFDAAPAVVGSHLQLTSGGAAAAALSLQGIGVPAIELINPNWTVTKGKPLAVQWKAQSGPWQIRLALNVDQHGLSPVTVVCDGPDTGTLTLSSGLVTALLNFGVSGAATATVERRTADQQNVAQGCVELVVASRVTAQATAE